MGEERGRQAIEHMLQSGSLLRCRYPWLSRGIETLSTRIASHRIGATGVVAPPSSRLLRSLLCAAAVLIALTVALAQAPAVPGSPALPLPAALAPAPFALPGSTQALEKQLSNLLRKLAPVQSADVLIAEQPAGGARLRVIVKSRAGKPLTPEIVGTMAEMLGGVVPGIAPDQVLITDSSGRLLYHSGRVVAPPAVEPLARRPWSWLVLALIAMLAVAWSVSRGAGRRLRGGAAPSREEKTWLERADARAMAESLARERPEMAALVLSRMPEGSARRVRRLLKRRGVELPLATTPAEPQVVQAVMRSIEDDWQTRHVVVR
jgi:hypothetical protein